MRPDAEGRKRWQSRGTLPGMIEVARVSAESWVRPEPFHDRWCDLATHPQWAAGMEFLRLDEPFGVGARGVLRLRSGRESAFEVTALVPGRVYADTTFLDGGRLTVHHEARPVGTGSHLELHAFVDGPRAGELAGEMGDEVQVALRTDLDALVRLVEHEVAARG